MNSFNGPQLNAIIHPANRLRICAMLAAADQVEFSVIQKQLGVSASVLSKQLNYLIDAGYVEQAKGFNDSRRAWLKLSKYGKLAYREHVAALRAMVAAADAADQVR